MNGLCFIRCWLSGTQCLSLATVDKVPHNFQVLQVSFIMSLVLVHIALFYWQIPHDVIRQTNETQFCYSFELLLQANVCNKRRLDKITTRADFRNLLWLLQPWIFDPNLFQKLVLNYYCTLCKPRRAQISKSLFFCKWWWEEYPEGLYLLEKRWLKIELRGNNFQDKRIKLTEFFTFLCHPAAHRRTWISTALKIWPTYRNILI